MPAKTVVQRRAMAIAAHHPEKLYARNRGLLSMGQEKLHEFAAVPEKGLPKKKGLMGHKGKKRKKKTRKHRRG